MSRFSTLQVVIIGLSFFLFQLYRTTAIRKSPIFVNVPVRSDGQGEFVSASDKADGLALTLTSLTT